LLKLCEGGCYSLPCVSNASISTANENMNGRRTSSGNFHFVFCLFVCLVRKGKEAVLGRTCTKMDKEQMKTKVRWTLSLICMFNCCYSFSIKKVCEVNHGVRNLIIRLNVIFNNKDNWKCISEIISCKLELCEIIMTSCCTPCILLEK
jgi:hypothetical protein